MSDHQLSKVTTGMVQPPLNPRTGAFSTLHDSDRLPHKSSMQERYGEDAFSVCQQEPKGFEPMSELERDFALSSPHLDRDQLTAEFYAKLQELKNEHRKTVKMLELLNADAEIRGRHAKVNPTRTPLEVINREDIEVERSRRDRMFLAEEESLGTTTEENFENEEEETESESLINDGPVVHETVKQMWDNFDMKDYLAPSEMEIVKEVKEKPMRVKSAPVRKEWSPTITIPKPFNMTLREEKKSKKSHTRSSEEVAQAEQERLEVEDYELQTRVRVRDPPAHTFLPLWEEIMERQEERSRMNRENASIALEAMVKPFSFMERERQIQEQKEKSKQLERRKEKKKLKSMVQFVAQPVPACVYDQTVANKMKEELLYRKIKVKLRSEDLMRSSALPPRMHSHEMMCAARRKARNRDIRRATKLSFRPETHDMPNFEVLHRHDDMARSSRKSELGTTMTEPFQFRTEALRRKKRAMVEASQKMSEDDLRSSWKSSKSKKYASTTDTIPARLTEAARLRIEETKRAIAKAEDELLELKLKDRERKEKQRKMAQEVTAKTMASEKDFTNPSDYRRERLKLYQSQQKARQAEYVRELKDMNDRLKQRPLLFEQQAQNSARQKAEKRYKNILRNSGLSDDMFDHSTGFRRSNGTDSRSFDNYSDDEFEVSITKSRPPPSGTRVNGVSKSGVDEDSHTSEETDEEASRTSVKKLLDFDI